ncbi:hypothetical protein HAX54_040065 [Datura stramonium]|uniref:Uncharacterized protein n=1 Tax=Datura stramonium TaxID=4076 RepID=A0ABS8VPJ3_DATST|nr:hypothetical protein [Datura stramonium]
MEGVHINVGELIADQFKWKANQQATTLPFPNLVSMLCLRAACPLFRQLDRTVRVDHVITLANKTDEDAQVLKRGKYTESNHLQPTMASSHTSEVPVCIVEPHTTLYPNLLVLAQKAKAHENHLMKLAKAIPSMIHLAIQRALQPSRDKFSGLCSTIDVFEKEIITLRKEISSPSAIPSPSFPSHVMPAVTHDKPNAPKSPPDDWCMGYDSASEMVPDEERYHNRHSPPPMHSVHVVDPLWTPDGVATTSYHELRTLLDKWVVPSSGGPVTLPPDPLQPMV